MSIWSSGRTSTARICALMSGGSPVIPFFITIPYSLRSCRYCNPTACATLAWIGVKSPFSARFRETHPRRIAGERRFSGRGCHYT